MDRSRLFDLAVRVLAHGMLLAESDCRRIVAAAEAQAATIIQEARDEIGRLRGVVEIVPAADALGGTVPRPWPKEQPSPPDWAEADSEVGSEFFESYAAPVGDRWGFLDDDDRVGVGPAIRRLLRRTPTHQPLG